MLNKYEIQFTEVREKLYFIAMKKFQGSTGYYLHFKLKKRDNSRIIGQFKGMCIF